MLFREWRTENDCMTFKLNQEFIIGNLVTKKGKFSQNKFQAIMNEIVGKYKEFSIDKGENIITTTKSIELVSGDLILDVEVLLPLKEEIFIEAPYEYKRCVKITNALYARVEDYTKLQEVLEEMNQYMSNNGLQPITSAYLVQSKENEKIIIEVYIGLNPNIL